LRSKEFLKTINPYTWECSDLNRTVIYIST
jgi:hypothetical protein